MVLVQKRSFFKLFFFQAIQTRKMSLTIFQNEKMPFQAIKTRSLKRFKIDIFLEWLTHGFGRKMSIFSTSFFLGKIDQENFFCEFQNEKIPFQTIKTRRSKSQKIDIFLKGLTEGLGPRMAIFPAFFFKQYRPGKCLFR